MTITIRVASEKERQLTERARQHGLPVEEYVLHLVEEDLAPANDLPPSDASGDAWLDELRQLASTAPKTPYIPAEALRRENLYEERS